MEGLRKNGKSEYVLEYHTDSSNISGRNRTQLFLYSGGGWLCILVPSHTGSYFSFFSIPFLPPVKKRSMLTHNTRKHCTLKSWTSRLVSIRVLSNLASPVACPRNLRGLSREVFLLFYEVSMRYRNSHSISSSPVNKNLAPGTIVILVPCYRRKPWSLKSPEPSGKLTLYWSSTTREDQKAYILSSLFLRSIIIQTLNHWSRYK